MNTLKKDEWKLLHWAVVGRARVYIAMLKRLNNKVSRVSAPWSIWLFLFAQARLYTNQPQCSLYPCTIAKLASLLYWHIQGEEKVGMMGSKAKESGRRDYISVFQYCSTLDERMDAIFRAFSILTQKKKYRGCQYVACPISRPRLPAKRSLRSSRRSETL